MLAGVDNSDFEHKRCDVEVFVRLKIEGHTVRLVDIITRQKEVGVKK